MRGFLFISDASFAILIITLSLIITVHVATTTIDTLSYKVTKDSVGEIAKHVVNVLLFAEDNRFRCTYGANHIPVPLCVWNNGANQTLFWADKKLNCSVVGSDPNVVSRLRPMLGCGSVFSPSAENFITVPFKLCWADSISDDAVRNCTLVDVNLIVWS